MVSRLTCTRNVARLQPILLRMLLPLFALNLALSPVLSPAAARAQALPAAPDFGPTLWNTFFGGPGGDEYAHAVAAAPDGGLAVLGSGALPWGSPLSPQSPAPHDDLWVAKLDGTGALVWSTYLGLAQAGSVTSYTDAPALAFDGGGNLLVAGTSQVSFSQPLSPHNGANQPTAFLVKLDASGKRVSSRIAPEMLTLWATATIPGEPQSATAAARMRLSPSLAPRAPCSGWLSSAAR